MSNNIIYGSTLSSEKVSKFIKHCYKINQKNINNNKPKTPTCIWGTHGIGKTDLVKQIAKELDIDFKYIALAQFEEMGDLLGMPDRKEGITIFNPPSWVPKDGHGILLIDDFNRADERILRGCMQLLQNYETAAWTLPEGWDIVLTANPTHGEYSVTDLDPAMLTRMRHISMKFNVQDWAKWAIDKGIHDICVNFVLTYPEIITNGKRTTPRSLVQFFDSIEPFMNDLTDSKISELIKALGLSTLDAETVATFFIFLNEDMSKIVSPEEIINNFNKCEKQIKEVSIDDKGVKRSDLISVMLTRLEIYLEQNIDSITLRNSENIISLISNIDMPKDLKFNFVRICSKLSTKNQIFKNIITNKSVIKEFSSQRQKELETC